MSAVLARRTGADLLAPQMVTLSTQLVRDRRLSGTAKAVFAVAVSLPGEAVIDVAGLGEWMSEDAEQIQAALQELERCGYLDADGHLTDCPAGLEIPDPPPPVRPPKPRPTPLPPAPSVVYFVERDDLIKIGVTRHLAKRVKALGGGQSMAPGMTVGPVTVLATEAGDREHEQRLHVRFARARVAGTEWFRHSPALRAYIADLAAAEVDA